MFLSHDLWGEFMKGLKGFSLLSVVIAALLLSAPAAKAYSLPADSYTITFIAPNQSAVAGSTVEFDAIITNLDPSNYLYLNGDSTASLDSPLTLDDSAFWAYVWPAPLNPSGISGDSYTGELFTVTVPLGTPVGTYEGEFDLLGGSNGGDSNLLGADDFTITVIVTPEPSSLVLLLTGMAGLAGTLRRRLIG
jgi:hypothetical protein